jgi:hypothetical protein
MARNTNVPFKGRIQKRKTYHLQIITFRLQRAAGPYRSANSRSEGFARHQGSVLAIGLVSVAASEAWVIAEPLIAGEAAHAIRMPAMAGKAVGFMAMVPLEAFLTVTMPLAFFNNNEGARSIRWLHVEEGRGDRKCPRRGRRFGKREQYHQGKEKTVRHVSSQQMRRPERLERRVADKTNDLRRFIYPV